MSAYSQAEFTSQYISDPAKDKENGLSALVRWIPGEVVAVYGAAVGLLEELPDSTAAGVIWLAALVFALVLSLLGAKPWEIGQDMKRKRVMAASLIFTAVAFVLWSFTIPASAGYRWSYAAEHSEISVLAALCGLLLGGLSDPILTWIKSSD